MNAVVNLCTPFWGVESAACLRNIHVFAHLKELRWFRFLCPVLTDASTIVRRDTFLSVKLIVLLSFFFFPGNAESVSISGINCAWSTIYYVNLNSGITLEEWLIPRTDESRHFKTSGRTSNTVSFLITRPECSVAQFRRVEARCDVEIAPPWSSSEPAHRLRAVKTQTAYENAEFSTILKVLRMKIFKQSRSLIVANGPVYVMNQTNGVH